MSGSLREALLIAGMFAVTFGVRYASIALVGRLRLPEPALRALGYVPVAVLTAIAVPYAVYRDGIPVVDFGNPYLLGAGVAVLVSYLTRNLLATIVVGLAFFFAYRAMLGL
jgi:branched-subunit amino acid transport protein